MKHRYAIVATFYSIQETRAQAAMNDAFRVIYIFQVDALATAADQRAADQLPRAVDVVTYHRPGRAAGQAASTIALELAAPSMLHPGDPRSQSSPGVFDSFTEAKIDQPKVKRPALGLYFTHSRARRTPGCRSACIRCSGTTRCRPRTRPLRSPSDQPRRSCS